MLWRIGGRPTALHATPYLELVQPFPVADPHTVDTADAAAVVRQRWWVSRAGYPGGEHLGLSSWSCATPSRRGLFTWPNALPPCRREPET